MNPEDFVSATNSYFSRMDKNQVLAELKALGIDPDAMGRIKKSNIRKVLAAAAWDNQLRAMVKEGKKLDKGFKVHLMKDIDPGCVYPTITFKGEDFDPYDEETQKLSVSPLLSKISKFIEDNASEIWM